MSVLASGDLRADRGGKAIRSLPALILSLSAAWALAVPPSGPPLRDVSGASLPPVTWTHEFDFDDGLQGWTIDPGSNPVLPARWIDPALEPDGPLLPDSEPSGTSGILGDAAGGSGGGSLYLPGDNANNNYSGTSPESIAERSIASLIGVSSTNSFVMQVDVYVPNLYTLAGPFRHNNAYPGNHIESSGLCMLDALDTAMCVEGAGTNITSGINGYIRFRDFTGGFGNDWQFPRCCGNRTIMTLEGTWPFCNNLIHSDKPHWWDNWITLYINYNYSRANEVYVWAYIPWQHPQPDCAFAASETGWVEILRRQVDPNFGLANWTRVQIGGRFSWSHAQFDNVKLAIASECNAPFFDADGDGDVDMNDFGAFQACYTGSNPPAGVYDPANCRCFDRDPVGAPDNDIDHFDFARFQACATRDGVPADPDCH
jgi:hypothetical protein